MDAATMRLMASNPTLELSAPALLVAMPCLAGGPFAQAVLVLVQHDAEGSMGIILNQPSGVALTAFATSLGVQFAGHAEAQVYVGGPVESERAFILHGGGHRGPETRAFMPDVAMSFSMESLAALAAKPPTELRVSIGYAGWGPGQLAQEVGLGAWLLMPADKRFVFHTEAQNMWHGALQAMGIEPLQLMQRSAASN